MDGYRIEHDSMGEVQVPKDALWRAQTQRAVENFPISGTPIEPSLVHAIGRVKAAAATVNAELGVLEAPRAEAIVAAATAVVEGEHDAVGAVDRGAASGGDGARGHPTSSWWPCRVRVVAGVVCPTHHGPTAG